jgi:two-component system NtrC family response regulator/two-component system nitrogen regulation response regulator GlnG
MGDILLVDDDDQLRGSFKRLLEMEGHKARAAASGEAALALADEAMPDAVIMDVRMPGLDGLGALRLLREKEPRLPVIIMTAYSTTESAIEATRLGAFDYILKPFDIPDVLALLDRALEAGRMMRRQVVLSPDAEERAAEERDAEALIGVSRAMHEVYKAIGRVAGTDALVLVRGESGTGKELVSRALYQYSGRSARPFSIINCVAIPDTLLESELFGYERGAFTGATARRIGKIEQAAGGTVFLDEIGDMPLNTQAKLLRLLQEKKIERLGGRDPVSVDVRIIAATNRDLEDAVTSGRFREDLYYRLNVVSIHLPPLRERREDIAHLARHFITHMSREMDSPAPEITPEALGRLETHPWPGNVRELANLMRTIIIFNQSGAIRAEDVARAFEMGSAGTAMGNGMERGLTEYVRLMLHKQPDDKVYDRLMDDMGKAVIREALTLCSGNRSRTARMLGLTRPTLLAKIEKYGL